MRPLFLVVVLAVGSALAGCGSGPHTQNVPIGSVCSSDGTCGTSPFLCNTKLPNGYCTEPCATDGDCPMDSACASGQCRRKCTVGGADAGTGCRDGYSCAVEATTSPVCDKM